MIRPREAPHCHRCSKSLVLRFDTTGLNGDQAIEADYEWSCPSCGASRPVVYLVERSRRKSA